MANNRNLTDRKIKSLKPRGNNGNKHYDTWDRLTPGLGIRTSSTGRRTFVLMARYPGSHNPTRRALGIYGELTLEEARTKARKWLGLIRNGLDPADAVKAERQAAARQQANTLATVIEDYLRLQVIGPDPAKPRQRKAREVARDLRRVFATMWGERPITSITRHDVLGLIERIRDQGTLAALGKKKKGKPITAHARNLLGCLKTFFAWAIERDTYGLENSPCANISAARIIGERQSSDRTLNDAELSAFWEATGHMGYPFGPLYRLLLLTGLRLNEVADAVWNEFDLAKQIWTLPAERMKGKSGKARPHSVPITPVILEILENLPRFNRGNYLFSLCGGERPVWVGSDIKHRLDARMLDLLQDRARQRGDDPAKATLPAFVNHDLRRTLRSRLSELRISSDVAEAVLAHVKPGIRGVYDRYELFDERRSALEAWHARLRAIVTQPPANIVPLRSAQA
jgi:integrase